MGIEVLVDLETNRGPTTNLFIRIDSWKVNMTINQVRFTTTSWLDKSFGDKFLRTYYDEDLNPAVGLVNSKLIYYKDDSSDGEEIFLDNLYEVPMYVEKNVNEPIYETKEVTKEVPYISFDEDGEEVTLYRTVTSPEKVHVGDKKVTKKVVDYSIVNKLEKFSYKYLVEELSKVFPKDKIKIVE